MVGRLHRRQAKQLEHMVLDHVTQRTGLVIIVRAALKAEILGHCDLDMVNIIARPEGLEQHVGKPQDHQVLHRLLAEVMVDAKDLALSEHSPDTVIDFAGGFEVSADRLFEHDPCLRSCQACPPKRLGNADIEARRCRQIKDARSLWFVREFGFERRPVSIRIGGIYRDIFDEFFEPLPRLGIPVLSRRGLAGLARHVAIRFGGQLRTCRSDDPARLRYLAIQPAVIERWQQLAPGEITGATEYNDIEWINRYEFGHRGRSPRSLFLACRKNAILSIVFWQGCQKQSC